MAVEKRCIDCGEKFLCGPVGERQCWCFYKPHVLPFYTADGDCVCPGCFDRRVERAEQARREERKRNSSADS